MDDVELDEDVLARGVDASEDALEGGVTVHEELHVVPAEERESRPGARRPGPRGRRPPPESYWAVCALGLLPEDGDLRERYELIQHFAETARSLRRERRELDQRVAGFALALLATGAGFAEVEEKERELGAET